MRGLRSLVARQCWKRWSSRTAAAAVVLLATACVSMPTEGPVEEAPQTAADPGSGGAYFDPKPPQKGETSHEIVLHFLDAMQATPIKSSAARQFLTTELQRTWEPGREILTYGEMGEPSGASSIDITAKSIEQYDARGAWVRGSRARTLHFSLVREDGEWRISSAPNALIVPESWFDSRFQRSSLYYFDPTGEIMVPQPVFVPRGDQSASALVRGLLVQPGREMTGVEHNYMPVGATAGLSVPITGGGIAQVDLTGDVGEIDAQTASKMLTQLVWTLRQEPRVSAVRLTVNGKALGSPRGPTQVDLDVGSANDPTGADATHDLFGLRDGLLVRGGMSSMLSTQGPFGVADRDIRSVGVNLSGSRVGAVSASGTTVFVAPVDTPDGAVVTVLMGSDLLPPVWDFADRMWMVDRGPRGAQVSLRQDGDVTAVAVPGVSGKPVHAFLVSRDGSRFVAIVGNGARSRVVSLRIAHGSGGSVRFVGRPVPLAIPSSHREDLRDIAWRTATSVAVLSTTNDDLAVVRTVSVDGAPGDVSLSGSSRLRGRARTLVGSPAGGTALLVTAGRRVTDLTAPERLLPNLSDGLRSLTYAG